MNGNECQFCDIVPRARFVIERHFVVALESLYQQFLSLCLQFLSLCLQFLSLCLQFLSLCLQFLSLCLQFLSLRLQFLSTTTINVDATTKIVDGGVCIIHMIQYTYAVSYTYKIGMYKNYVPRYFAFQTGFLRINRQSSRFSAVSMAAD